MNRHTRTRRIVVLLSTIGTLVVLAGAAQAATSKPAGMSTPEYRALMLRSQALNDKYGLGKPVGKPTGMSQAEYRALMLRSQALNEKYGLGGSAKVAAPSSQHEAQIVSSNDFAWGDFGIGAAAMLGLVLLATGLIAGGRRGRRAPRTRTS
jgi:hypothetical protein